MTAPTDLRVRIIRETYARGERLKHGQIVNLPYADAKALLRMHKAELAPAPAREDANAEREPAAGDPPVTGGKPVAQKPAQQAVKPAVPQVPNPAPAPAPAQGQAHGNPQAPATKAEG